MEEYGSVGTRGGQPPWVTRTSAPAKPFGHWLLPTSSSYHPLTPMSTLRINGLVRLANAIRRDMPLSADRKPHWQKTVASALQSVEQILRKAGRSERDLPAPSRRALHFLRNIDWNAASPSPTSGHAAPRGQVTWKGLNSFLDRTLDRLAEASQPAALDEIHHSIDAASRRIEGVIERHNTPPDHLTPSSRAIRGWLAFFAVRSNLDVYAKALQTATPILTPAARDLNYTHPLAIQFRPTKLIYRLRNVGSRSIIWLPTPMVAFDAAEFALVAELMRGRDPAAKTRVLQRMADDPFQLVRAELESLSGIVQQPRGAYHDLSAAFDRVNTAFFNSQMPRPHLTWSRVFTGRKFGHYDSIRDTVMISSTLDQRTVEPFVVDSVLYHELLHKAMGARTVNGRRYVHTREFHDAERRFPRHQEAEQILHRLAAHAAPPEGSSFTTST